MARNPSSSLVASLIAAWLLCSSATTRGADYFLTIGGGYSPTGNQASLERNVLFYQRLLRDKKLDVLQHDIYFADGSNPRRDLQVVDRAAIPKANQLMAEFFGSQRDLGLSYRDHQVPDVNGDTSPENIRKWFDNVGATLSAGDRLILYVTSHGGSSASRDQPHNTAISLWNNKKLPVAELADLLDRIPESVSVVTIMVQCHSGGFARLIYDQGDSDQGFCKQTRCGFFATVHDRPAAGCTPDIDEASYVEYSTFFWEALAGFTRTGDAISPPDYDGDGTVSFDEAHAYTVLNSDTIDLPIKTSGELLSVESGFRDQDHPDLLPRDLPYDELLELATPSERAILTGLSQQLNLSGNNRLVDADSQARPPRGRGRGRSGEVDRSADIRRRIAGDIRRHWPELANLMNPIAIELVTTGAAEFVKRIENHPQYKRYRELAEGASKSLSPQEKRVKYERFVRTAENVIMRENLVRLGNQQTIARYQAIVHAEAGSL
jgi:hypothetical protein